jgi:hypothetical protein
MMKFYRLAKEKSSIDSRRHDGIGLRQQLGSVDPLRRGDSGLKRLVSFQCNGVSFDCLVFP